MKTIRVIEYQYGQEEWLMRILYQSKEPIKIKIKNFTDIFNLDYFQENIEGKTTYSIFENNMEVGHSSGDFKQVIEQIKNNVSYRIFGQILPSEKAAIIERKVPLWQVIPFRPRFFAKKVKTLYFFGGKNAFTNMHYDREHCCNLHLCLSGKKQLLLFTEDQNDALYKIPFVGDSMIDFSKPLKTILQQFPKLNDATGYNVILEPGDMIFMPRNCWHHTKYLEPSSAASYVFYPQKILQIYGFFTGFFYLAYRQRQAGFNIGDGPLFQKFNSLYAFASGRQKKIYKILEKILYPFLLLPISIMFYAHHRNKPRRYY